MLCWKIFFTFCEVHTLILGLQKNIFILFQLLCQKSRGSLCQLPFQIAYFRLWIFGVDDYRADHIAHGDNRRNVKGSNIMWLLRINVRINEGKIILIHFLLNTVDQQCSMVIHDLFLDGANAFI